MALIPTAQRRTQSTTARAQDAAIDPQQVAHLAYALYEQRGREEGHAMEDWLKAEQLIRQQARN